MKDIDPLTILKKWAATGARKIEQSLPVKNAGNEQETVVCIDYDAAWTFASSI